MLRSLSIFDRRVIYTSLNTSVRRCCTQTSKFDLKNDIVSIEGFQINGIKAGLKPSGALDLALMFSSKPCTAAAVFTKNKIAAAPIHVNREILNRCKGENVSALLINAGCANAATGEQGILNARKQTDLVKSHLFNSIPDLSSREVLVLSTGVIGQQLDMEKMEKGIIALSQSLNTTDEAWKNASRAIMTTDTVPKRASITYNLHGKDISINGLAKGAGMIHPNMATLLVIMSTNANISPECLNLALKHAADRSFNCIDIDGVTSTNDSCVILANKLHSTLIDDPNSHHFIGFRDNLTLIMQNLAKQIVRDGEGATKFITINVNGAYTYNDAVEIGKKSGDF